MFWNFQPLKTDVPVNIKKNFFEILFQPLKKTRHRRLLASETAFRLHENHFWVLDEWYAARGDETLRLDWPLSEGSVVFDIGGYEGKWSAGILSKYRPRLHIFEPHPEMAEKLSERFSGLSNVTLHRYGAGEKDGALDFYLNGMASSFHLPAPDKVSAPVRDIGSIIEELAPCGVELMKINIEGGEFPLLEKLVRTDLIRKIKHLQVQFHLFYPDARRLRAELRRSLSRTHRSVWNYPFVWEAWSLR